MSSVDKIAKNFSLQQDEEAVVQHEELLQETSEVDCSFEEVEDRIADLVEGWKDLMGKLDDVKSGIVQKGHELEMKKRENQWNLSKLEEKKRELNKTANAMAENDMKWRIAEQEKEKLIKENLKLKNELFVMSLVLEKQNDELEANKNNEWMNFYESDTFSD